MISIVVMDKCHVTRDAKGRRDLLVKVMHRSFLPKDAQVP